MTVAEWRSGAVAGRRGVIENRESFQVAAVGTGNYLLTLVSATEDRGTVVLLREFSENKKCLLRTGGGR